MREFYKSEDDLPGIKDSVLLDTCKKVELISDVVHKKLTHILTMRNDIAASHPNVEMIGGFELLGWLQVCINDVLEDNFSESAIKIKALIDNLKTTKSLIDDSTLASINTAIADLSLAHANNMLITIFGMFLDDKTEAITKKNIAKLAPSVWYAAGENVKHNIGIKLEGYKNNLHEDKHQGGLLFLEIVDGLSYQTKSAKTLKIDDLFDQLWDARYGWDNFHHEAPIVREIQSYIKKSEDIPEERINKIAKTLMVCRVGKGISYSNGVSPYAKPSYDQLLGLFDDNGIVWCIIHMFSPEVNSLIMNNICKKQLAEILEILEKNAVGERLKAMIHFLQSNLDNAYKANKNPEFIEISKVLINWKN